MGRASGRGQWESRVRSVRISRGMSQKELAEGARLTRQAVSAIEAGRYIPSVAVALRLAQVLQCRVEELFVLSDSVYYQNVQVSPAPMAEVRRLAAFNIRGQLVAHLLAGGMGLQEGFAAADGLLRHPGAPVAELWTSKDQLENTVLVLGCDPGLNLLRSRFERWGRGPHMYWLSASSQFALDTLGRGEAHVAGCHLHDPNSGQYNVPQARSVLAKTGGMVVGFARWEFGLVVAPGNPKQLRSVADLARPDVRIVNREAGSGSRALLDELLARDGVPREAVRGYERFVTSHLAVAHAVAGGCVDAGVAPKAVAAVMGLDFVPICYAQFDLVIPRDHLAHPAVVRLLDLLQSYPVRAELSALPGYDVSHMGSIVADIPPT